MPPRDRSHACFDDRATDRANERGKERARERARERASARANVRVDQGVTGRPGVRRTVGSTAGVVAAAAVALAVAVAVVTWPAVSGTAGSPQSSRSSRQGVAEAKSVVTVLAASSLADVVDASVAAMSRLHPDVEIRASYGGSSTLARQIDFGAPADVFLSADRRQADLVVRSGRARGEPVPFATNRVVVLVRRDGDLTEVDDLVRDGVRLVVAAPDVPAGAYAGAALTALERERGPSFVATLRSRIVSEEPSVRLAVTRVELGAADAAFAYATDVRAAPSTRMVDLPASVQPSVDYVLVPLHGPVPDAADRFVAFLLSDEGRTLLLDAGFGVPPATGAPPASLVPPMQGSSSAGRARQDAAPQGLP